MENVIVLFGGKSSEHDISLITANLVLNAIDEEKYKVYPILVDKDNKWHYVKDFKNNINKNNKKEEIFIKLGEKTLYKKSGLFTKKFIDVDCAVLCHHGLNGEDGTIQGVLELCNIPYTSSGVNGSSNSMDKVIMKLLFKQFGFNVVNYFYFNKSDYEKNENKVLDSIENKLSYPLIIKPANLGSSIGITIAKNREELESAILVALEFDNKILIERALTNFKEINCACMGFNDDLIVSSLEEPVNWKEFLTFDDKYISGDKKAVKKIYPANLDEETTLKIQQTTKDIFKKFELSGVVRIDYMVTDDEIYVNEINSIPGSLAYYLFEKENLSFTEVIDKLIEFAKQKNMYKNKLTYAFTSNVLEKMNIQK